MKSVILAGGFGTRIRPLTLSVPKPLINFCNRPSIEYQIEACKKSGVDHIIIAIYESDTLEDTIKKLGEKHSVRIDLSVESSPLGTAGSIRLAKDLICDDKDESEEFFVFNSDIICKYPLSELVETHRKNNAKVTKVENPNDFGVIVHDEFNKIMSFVEKPKNAVSDVINAGVYVLSKEVLDLIPLKNYSIEKQFFPKFLKQRSTFCYELKGYWADIGNPERYLEAQSLYLSHLVGLIQSKQGDETYVCELLEDHGRLLCSGQLPSANFSFGSEGSNLEQSDFYETFRFKGPIMIHPTAVIGEDCMIGPNVCVGPNVRIGKGCRILNSTLMQGVEVESSCYVEDSIIGWDSNIKRWTRVEGLSVFGKSVTVGESLFVRGCVVLPHKIISSSIYEKDKVII